MEDKDSGDSSQEIFFLKVIESSFIFFNAIIILQILKMCVSVSDLNVTRMHYDTGL